MKTFYKLVILAAILVSAATYAKRYFQPNAYIVVGESMEPTLYTGNTMVGLQGFPRFKRGDIVTFIHEDILSKKKPKRYVKRIAGLPGDQLTFNIKTGELLKVNQHNVKLEKTLMIRKLAGKGLKPDEVIHEVTVRAHDYSHNAISFLHNEDLAVELYQSSPLQYLRDIGENTQKVSVITVPKNYYFMLSDNRVFGHDSRTLGPIHQSNITEKVINTNT